jgi:ATP-dependent Clp protease ATP-binding subunit ClpA
VGQPRALDAILPTVRLWEAGLALPGKPAGVFLLLGPTGTGKTHTVESVAEGRHGSKRHVLRIDCGEYQMDHEVAKLIGAPPGYLGHKETQPLLSQSRLNAVATVGCGLAVVLLDEIEKAAPSMWRLLLDVLDKGQLRLGDNSVVNFESSLIFMTSNTGAQDLRNVREDRVGFPGAATPGSGQVFERAARRHFSPEFLNRCDAIVTYDPLTREAAGQVLDLQLADLQRHFQERLAPDQLTLTYTDAAREVLLNAGFSPRYGAREMKRVVRRMVLERVATILVAGGLPKSAKMKVDAGVGGLDFVVGRR